MKKFMSLMLALIMGLIGIAPAAVANVSVNYNDATVEVAAQPADAADTEWNIGYHARCGYYRRRHNKIKHNTHRATKFAKQILLAPLTILLGVTYTCSYKDANGKTQSKDFDRFIDARIALTKIKQFKNKTVAKSGIIRRNDSDNLTPEEKARASSAGLIRKINLVAGTEEYIPLAKSSLKRKLAKMGEIPFDAVMKINCSANEYDDEELYSANCKVERICDTGYVDKHGCKWIPLLASASDKRKGTFMAIRADLYPKMGKWLVGGVPTKYVQMVVAKYLVYMGLQTSSSIPMKEVFGETFDFSRVAVVDDVEMETITPRTVWFVTKTLKVIRKLLHKETLNVFDGMGVYFTTNKVREAFSGRFGIMTKFLLIPQSRKQWESELKKRGLRKEFTQFDGTTMNLDNTDVILTKSCFKGTALFKTVQEWRDACVANGYDFNVCIRQHKKQLKSLSYQQGQLLRGTASDALGLVSHAIKTVQKWTKPEEAARIIGGWLGACCAIYPPLLKARFVQLVLQERYKSQRKMMMSGRIPDAGYSVFVAPDPKPFFCHVFGIPMEFQIEEDEAIFSWMEDGDEGVLTRNPATDGCPVVTFKKTGWGCYDGIVYIHPLSWTPILLRLDYDGDHLMVVTDPYLVKLFKQTFQMIEKIPIVWEAPKGQKTKITKSAIEQAIKDSIVGGKIGIHADNLTKLWNISKEDREALEELYGPGIVEELICIEVRNVNVDIDSTKNAGDTIKHDREQDEKVKKLRKIMLPDFCRFEKENEQHPAEDAEYWDKRCKYTGSLLDIYSKTVAKRLPEILEVKGMEDVIFCSANLLKDEHVRTSEYMGLAEAGTLYPETDEYVNEGLFNNISFRHKKEQEELLGKQVSPAEYKEAVREAALAEIKEYVKAFGGTEEGASDVIIRWVVCNTKSISDNYLKRVSTEMTNLYGEKMFYNLCLNLNAPENDIPYYDDDSEE